MTLSSEVDALAARIATEVNSIRSEIDALPSGGAASGYCKLTTTSSALVSSGLLVPWSIAMQSGGFTVSNDTEISVPADGVYLVIATASVLRNFRTEMVVTPYVNGSALSEWTANYATRDATHDEGSVTHSTLLDLDTTDTLEIEALNRGSTGGSLEPDGTRCIITRV